MTAPIPPPNPQTWMNVYDEPEWQMDVSALLAPTDTVASATPILVNRADNTEVALSVASTFSGNVITQQVVGPLEVTRGGSYVLVFRFTSTAGAKLGPELDIVVRS